MNHSFKQSLIITGFAIIIGLLLRIEHHVKNIEVIELNYSINDVIEHGNDRYKAGMLYAYDNVVVCGASPEDEGLNLTIMMDTEISNINCGE